MPFADIVAMFVVVFLFVGTPGPANLILMSAGSRWGLRACLPFIVGVTLGKFLLNLTLAFGLLALLKSHPLIEVSIQLISGAYMIYLAWQIAKLRLSQQKTADDRVFSFWAGLVVHPLNPKAWAMITYVYSQFTQPQQDWVLQVAIIACVFLTVQALVHPIWCWGGEVLAKWFSRHGGEKAFLWLMSLVTVGLVLWLTYQSVRESIPLIV